MAARRAVKRAPIGTGELPQRAAGTKTTERAKRKPAKKSARNTSTGGAKAASGRNVVKLVSSEYRPLEYRKDIDAFVVDVRGAAPMTLVETERSGVSSRFVKELPERMHIPATRLYSMLGIPKATIEKKAAANQALTGMGGKSALGLARLLGIAQSIVANSTAPEAKNFDAVGWLGQWLDSPQPALGGRKPGDLIDTPTGVDVVARLLGALESGAYQ